MLRHFLSISTSRTVSNEIFCEVILRRVNSTLPRNGKCEDLFSIQVRGAEFPVHGTMGTFLVQILLAAALNYMRNARVIFENTQKKINEKKN